MKKWVYGVIVVLIFATIIYLTFQTPEQTTGLSESLRLWLQEKGIVIESIPLRHYIHYVIYFIFGIFLTLWLRDWRAVVVGCCIGLADETLKNWLPTREFDLTDVLRDCVGVGVAYVIVAVVNIRGGGVLGDENGEEV